MYFRSLPRFAAHAGRSSLTLHPADNGLGYTPPIFGYGAWIESDTLVADVDIDVRAINLREHRDQISTRVFGGVGDGLAGRPNQGPK